MAKVTMGENFLLRLRLRYLDLLHSKSLPFITAQGECLVSKTVVHKMSKKLSQ